VLKTRGRTRVTNANKAKHTLIPVLNSQSVFGAEKIKTSKTLIITVASYGALSWTVS